MIGSNKGNWGRYGLQAFGISVLGPLLFYLINPIIEHFKGNRVRRIYDVGVAGLHRLLARQGEIRAANVCVVVAGMEGALVSVVGGLVDKPVIAVPTSIGYGANFHGLSALLSMLNSCAAGVSVVNIDNGFGAGRLAAMINEMR